MTTIQEKYGLNPPIAYVVSPTLPPFPMDIPSEHLIGIEVEVENVSGVSMPRGSAWQTVSDGSLRNNGIEFITQPIRACDAPKILHQLMSGILNQECHFSPRTSVHIHLNVQDIQSHQVQDMVMLYTVFERLFYRFAGRGRIRNIFCVPLCETSLLTEMSEKELGKDWNKYTGLNLVTIRGDRDGGSAYGTIEFRQMHGTPNVEKLCLWIDLITSLKTYVMNTSSKIIRNTIISMDDDFDFHQLLRDIFGHKADWLKYDGVEEIKVAYLAAKSALLSSKVRSRVHTQATADSPFYQFKG